MSIAAGVRYVSLTDGISLAHSSIPLNHQLKSDSLRDPATGLYNRRYLEDALDRVGQSAARFPMPVLVMMFGRSNFK
jgi:GGDEF domain-containing protein